MSAMILPPTPAAVVTSTQGLLPLAPQEGSAGVPPPTLEPQPDAEQQTVSTFRGRLVSVDEIGTDIGILQGRVVDENGNGIPGVQLTINGGGAPVFEPTTGPNGEFRYDMLNAYASPRWNIRVIGVPDSEELHLDVQPFKQYTVVFQRQ